MFTIYQVASLIHPQVGESLAISGLHQLHQGAADTSPNQKRQEIKLVSAYAPHKVKSLMQRLCHYHKHTDLLRCKTERLYYNGVETACTNGVCIKANDETVPDAL